MENEPDTTNVVFLDEYPHLPRHSAKIALAGVKRIFNSDAKILDFPEPLPEPPDDAA